MNEFKIISNYLQKLTKNNPSAIDLNDDVFFNKKKKISYISRYIQSKNTFS